jgi:hypothetical protein
MRNRPLLQNFNLYASISPTSSKSFVSFVGHESDGSPATFKVKVKSDEEANELTGVIEKESKTKSED